MESLMVSDADAGRDVTGGARCIAKLLFMNKAAPFCYLFLEQRQVYTGTTYR
ncbi:hypothetical protein D3C77_627510 [compost metagenome]